MNDEQLLRYSRHILMDEIDIEAQQRFLDAHVMIVGAGGLGSPAALYLAAAGVGQITIIDDDRVELTNLQRQIIHSNSAIGRFKVESARDAMNSLNPGVQVNTFVCRAGEEWFSQRLHNVSVVLDCSDNYSTRHAINRSCVKENVPLVFGAAIQFRGQTSTFDFRTPHSPCYACMFLPDDDLDTFVEQTCSELGVFGPTVGIIGAIQAAEALRVIGGFGETLQGRLLLLDSSKMQWSTLSIERDADCPVCRDRKIVS